MSKKYLDFDEEYNKGKTKKFTVLNNVTGDDIGEIKWHGAWRQYCFFPDYETFWSRGCLQEIQEFIYKLMCERQKDRDAFGSEDEYKNTRDR